jgi:hypothetical protein
VLWIAGELNLKGCWATETVLNPVSLADSLVNLLLWALFENWCENTLAF